jgi:hypothetical protein
VRPGLREEVAAEVVHREIEEREQQPEQDVRAECAEHRLVCHAPVLEDAREGHRQGRRHEQRHRQQVRQPDDRRRVEDQHERRERDAARDRDHVPASDGAAGVGIADRDDERERRQQRAPDGAPAAVVHQFEQEEVRDQEREQHRVAVERPHDVAARRPPTNSFQNDGSSSGCDGRCEARTQKAPIAALSV